MSSKRVFMGLLTLSVSMTVGVAIVLTACVTMLRSNSQKLVTVKLDSRVLEEKQSSLKIAQAAVTKYRELDTIARAVVPQDKDQANSVRSISAIADQLGISLSAISFPPSTLGQSTLKNKTGSITQVSPVPGLKGVYEMDITVQQDTTKPVSFGKFLEFLSKLEANRRTAQVSSITITPSTTDRSAVTFNVVLSTYIKP